MAARPSYRLIHWPARAILLPLNANTPPGTQVSATHWHGPVPTCERHSGLQLIEEPPANLTFIEPQVPYSSPRYQQKAGAQAPAFCW